MTLFVLACLVPTIALGWAFCWLVRKLAPRYGLIDQPAGGHKTHRDATPLGGGIAVWLSLLFVLALAQVFLLLVAKENEAWRLFGWELPDFLAKHLSGAKLKLPLLWVLFGGATLLMLIGLADDRFGLSWKLRLAVQFLVAILVVSQGVQVTLFLEVPWLTGAITVLWIVGLINSFNMLDNMDGLSAGVAAIAAGLFSLVMLLNPETPGGDPQWFVAGYLLLMTGALLGFLAHNYPPAKLFLGDAGSYVVGFWLATGTVLATFAAGDGGHPAFVVLAPLCVLAVPLYDICTVILIRLRERRSPFQADRKHFSHRLVELGMSRPQAVRTIYLVTLATGFGAVLLYEVRSTLGAVIVLLLVLCLLSTIHILEGRKQE